LNVGVVEGQVALIKLEEEEGLMPRQIPWLFFLDKLSLTLSERQEATLISKILEQF
jgi:hypothetical protein